MLVLALGTLGFVEKSAAPLVRQLRVEMAGGFFLFFPPLFLVLWAVYCKQQPWRRITRWLACEQHFVPSVPKAGYNWGLRYLTASSCKVVRSVVVLTRQQLCCPTAAILAGQLLSSNVGQFNFDYSLQSPKTSSATHHSPALGGWLVTPPPLSAFNFPAFLH
jgi:hypothetical protein